MLKLCKRVACTNTHKSYKIVQNVLYNKKLSGDRKFVHLLDNILQVAADLVFVCTSHSNELHTYAHAHMQMTMYLKGLMYVCVNEQEKYVI